MPDEGKATDTFLYVEGIDGKLLPGDCVDKWHPGTVQLQSFDMSVSADRSEDEVKPKDLWHPKFHHPTFIIVTARPSAMFFKAACAGSKFRRVFVFCRKRGSGIDYLQWRFTDVQVVEYNMKIADDKPEETIKIDYMEVEFYYARQNHQGALIDAVAKSWSRYTNAEADLQLPFDAKQGTSVYGK